MMNNHDIYGRTLTQVTTDMSANRWKYFRWTPRTAWITFAYVVAVPAIFGYVGFVTDVSYRPSIVEDVGWDMISFGNRYARKPRELFREFEIVVYPQADVGISRENMICERRGGVTRYQNGRYTGKEFLGV